MKSSLWFRVGRLWAVGFLMMLLRLIQNRTGFDPATGLSLPSVAGTVLVVCIAVIFILETVLALVRGKREKVSFDAHFAPPEKSMMPMVMGCMLLVAGGGLLAATAVMGGAGIAPVVTGVLGLVSGGSLLVLVRQMRGEDEASLTTVLPALFFGVFLVLTVYLPVASDPVLARYYLQVLAAALAAYAFAQLAGFFRLESSARNFTLTANLAVMLCLAAMADGQPALMLLYGGCAVVFSGFLALQK